MGKRAYLAYLLVSVFAGCSGHQSNAITVDHDHEIVFGQSGSFSGHFKYYGITIRDAINAYFDQVNKAGGIRGKKLRLISLDDQGDAEQTKKNIDELYTKYGIDKFIGVMGTRGILLELPLIKSKKIAFFFTWGSDQQLRDQKLNNIINGFGLLNPQVDLLREYVVNTLSFKNIGIFHADDALSVDAANYLVKKLELNGITPTVARYNRFTMNIESAATNLLKKDPRAVICIGTSMPTVKLINAFFENGFFGTQFLGIDSTFLVPELLRYKGASFKFVSAVPDPLKSSLPIAQEYRAAFSSYLDSTDYSTLSFSYFISTAIVCKALEQTTLFSNEAIIKEIESFKSTTISGFPIAFDASNRYVFGEKLWLI